MIDFMVVVSGFGAFGAMLYVVAVVKDGVEFVGEISNIDFGGY